MSDAGAADLPAVILVVDDTEANRYAIVRHLTAGGFRVEEAASGTAGLQSASSVLPDLIVLDIRLPDMSGLEVTRRIRANERTADIPILHISASFTDAASRARGLDNGADGYLTHPVDPPVMLATVRALLCARDAEREALRRARQWHATFDAIGEGVCITDAGGRIRRCNRAFHELTGLREGGPDGAPPLSELVPGIESIPEPPFIRMAGGGRDSRVEVGGRWLHVSMVPVAGDAGEADGAVCVLTDLTRERQVDERVRQALQLESTGRLAGGVAHEVNNMMTAILAHTEFALRALVNVDLVRMELEGIHKAATRSAKVARQLLTFSRRQVIQPRVVDVHVLLRDMYDMMHRHLGADRELRFELGAEVPWVVVDPLGLEQILTNLVLNARDAMPHGGTLDVRTANVQLDATMVGRYPEIDVRQGPYVEIAVSDTGYGMGPETLGRIFEPFFTTKEVGKGTGLGLAMVYGMVKQSDGYIWVASEPGQGATFTVQLPQVEPATARARLESSRTSPWC
jgi:signal transduction histidine kinase